MATFIDSRPIATENAQEAARMVAAGLCGEPLRSQFKDDYAAARFDKELASYRKQFSKEK
jgi:hypothetical protein